MLHQDRFSIWLDKAWTNEWRSHWQDLAHLDIACDHKTRISFKRILGFKLEASRCTIHVNTRVHIDICIHTYVYIHIYTYIYVYIYTTGTNYGIFSISVIFFIFVVHEGCFFVWNTCLRADITFWGANSQLKAKWTAKFEIYDFGLFSVLDSV